MNTTNVSATDLKHNISDILNRVYYEKIEAIISRHNIPIARISPITNAQKPVSFASSINKYFGIWKAEKWANCIGKKNRYFRKRELSLA